MDSHFSFIDKVLLLILFFTFDLVVVIPFLLGFSLLLGGVGISLFLFLMGGAFLSSAIGINPELFWGDLLGSFNQIFYIFDYFFYWYDYLLVGFFAILLSLLLVTFFFFSLISFLQFFWKYMVIRYRGLYRAHRKRDYYA